VLHKQILAILQTAREQPRVALIATLYVAGTGLRHSGVAG